MKRNRSYRPHHRINPDKAVKAKKAAAAEAEHFYGLPLPNFNPEGLEGHLIVVEGIDGSGRTTQIALLTEWLESEGYAVRTMGLRRSSLLSKNIDDVLEKNVVTRLTLALLYATDFFDQLEHVIIPSLRAGSIVLADRYIFTLIARAAVRGIRYQYLRGIYQLALKPHLTFMLDVGPEAAFERELKKAQGISYWESGRDMHLSSDLYESFMRYQSMVRKEFHHLSKRHGFINLDGESSIPSVNRELRKAIAGHLGIDNIRYTPSSSLIHLWR